MFKNINTPVFACREPWLQENGLNNRLLFVLVLYFAGNPVIIASIIVPMVEKA